ncbi:unnamed protein product, partial [Amoebophrya sp. A120]
LRAAKGGEHFPVFIDEQVLRCFLDCLYHTGAAIGAWYRRQRSSPEEFEAFCIALTHYVYELGFDFQPADWGAFLAPCLGTKKFSQEEGPRGKMMKASTNIALGYEKVGIFSRTVDFGRVCRRLYAAKVVRIREDNAPQDDDDLHGAYGDRKAFAASASARLAKTKRERRQLRQDGDELNPDHALVAERSSEENPFPVPGLFSKAFAVEALAPDGGFEDVNMLFGPERAEAIEKGQRVFTMQECTHICRAETLLQEERQEREQRAARLRERQARGRAVAAPGVVLGAAESAPGGEVERIAEEPP